MRKFNIRMFLLYSDSHFRFICLLWQLYVNIHGCIEHIHTHCDHNERKPPEVIGNL